MVEIVAGGSLENATGDLLAVPVLADTTFGPGGEAVAEQLGDWLDAYLETHEFTGKAGQRVSRVAEQPLCMAVRADDRAVTAYDQESIGYLRDGDRR